MPIAGEPPRRDLMLWRGDEDPPAVWIFGDAGMPEFLDGATFLLIVQWGVKPAAGAPCRGLLLTTGEFTLSSEDDTLAVDAAEQTVSWTPTLAEFAAIPSGAPMRYELKRIIAGKARTAVWGEVKIGSGLLRAPGETPGPIGQSYTDIRVAALRSELLAAIAAVEPGQGGGGSSALVVPQTTPSASWAIPHPFGRLPSVTVYDASGSELIADISATPTMVSVVFAQPTAGSAVLA